MPNLRDDKRKLLILDLDETLLYAAEHPLDRPADFILFDYFVYRRPHLDRFLHYALDRFRVAVWTSSGSEYATGIVERIFPSPDDLEFIWAAERGTRRFDPEEQKSYDLKQLKKVRRLGYNLEQVLVIDDTPEKHEQNYGNLIQVREYNGSVEDVELFCLEKYLALLEPIANVRAVEKRGWRNEVGCL
jgi:RNA polymerase II subunit A small phosphatase-like protein